MKRFDEEERVKKEFEANRRATLIKTGIDKINAEKNPLLFDSLKQLEAEEILTKIKNDFWILGEVVTTLVSPVDHGLYGKRVLIEPDHDHMLDAVMTTLRAEWPRFVASVDHVDGDKPGYDYTVPAHIAITVKFIEVISMYRSDDEKSEPIVHLRFDYRGNYTYEENSINPRDPEAKKELIRRLVKDSHYREVGHYDDDTLSKIPYNEAAKRAEEKIIEEINLRGFVPDEQHKHFLELAKKYK